MNPISNDRSVFQYQSNINNQIMWSYNPLNQSPSLFTFSGNINSPSPFTYNPNTISTNSGVKRFMDDSEETHRDKIFASTERMADRLSHLRITDEDTTNVQFIREKRLYFHPKLGRINSSLAIPEGLISSNSSNNCMALIPWQPPLVQIPPTLSSSTHLNSDDESMFD